LSNVHDAFIFDVYVCVYVDIYAAAAEPEPAGRRRQRASVTG